MVYRAAGCSSCSRGTQLSGPLRPLRVDTRFVEIAIVQPLSVHDGTGQVERRVAVDLEELVEGALGQLDQVAHLGQIEVLGPEPGVDRQRPIGSMQLLGQGELFADRRKWSRRRRKRKRKCGGRAGGGLEQGGRAMGPQRGGRSREDRAGQVEEVERLAEGRRLLH